MKGAIVHSVYYRPFHHAGSVLHVINCSQYRVQGRWRHLLAQLGILKRILHFASTLTKHNAIIVSYLYLESRVAAYNGTLCYVRHGSAGALARFGSASG